MNTRTRLDALRPCHWRLARQCLLGPLAEHWQASCQWHGRQTRARFEVARSSEGRLEPRASRNGLRRFILPILVTAIAVLIHLLPGAPALLELGRTAVATGQWWRLLTGHLAHFTTEHLAWDAGTFLALALIAARLDGRRWLTVTITAATAISAAFWWWLPGLDSYRGLSGIDSALFAFVAGHLLHRSVAARRALDATLIALLLTALGAKIAFEVTTGATLFVDSAATFVPVPLAHATGAAIGFLGAVARSPE